MLPGVVGCPRDARALLKPGTITPEYALITLQPLNTSAHRLYASAIVMETIMFDKGNIDRMFSIYPSIKTLLQESKNVKMARFFVTRYLEEHTQVLNTDKSKIKPVEWLLQSSCLTTFRRILWAMNEHL